MVIQNIKDIFGYSSKSVPKDFLLLINLLKKNQEIDEDTFNLLFDSYNFTKEAHKNQKRKSGEPYFNHCIEVASILADWGMDKNMIISGMLHDTLEDTDLSKKG